MKRNILLSYFIYFSIILTGCNVSVENEKNNKDNMVVELIEQETVSQESIKPESDGQEEADKDNIEERTYMAEDYGEIQEYGGEFYYDEDTQGFYYNLETYYLNADFLYTMNDTLERIYDDYLYQYQETENWYMEQGPQDIPEGKVPYSELKFLGVQYVDNDYVSLLFNDITYMGGAHPYSMLDAITIDRHSGEEVNASEVLGESDEEILDKVNESMGLEEYTDWAYLDFYLQEDEIVFFYRMPGYWEDVVLGR